MLLLADNGYKYYKIDSVEELRKIRPWLVVPMKEMQDQLPSDRTVEELLNQTDARLAAKDDTFGLWLITSNGEVVTTLITNLILNENYELCCYVSGRYFKKGMLRELGNYSFHYLENWAKDRQCLKMIFLTSRNVKAYTRLLKDLGLKPTETLFTKELKYE